jgi:hypothetical protein
MNNPFDELAKGLAQSVTRRAALKRFGVGLAGMALAVLGFESAKAAPTLSYVCCLYERYYPAPPTRKDRYVTLCMPPGSTCAPTLGGWESYQKRLIKQTLVQDCNHCK